MLMLGTKDSSRAIIVIVTAVVPVPGAIGLLVPSDRGPRR
jgi:hypothetical protein